MIFKNIKLVVDIDDDEIFEALANNKLTLMGMTLDNIADLKSMYTALSGKEEITTENINNLIQRCSYGKDNY